jgi:hypothetical protein
MRLRALGFCAATVVACQSLVGAAQPRQDGNPDVNPLAAALVDFRERIETYMELRDDITDEVGDPESTRHPAEIRARETALATRIQARRAGANHGDIFTPAIRAAFRRLLAPHTTGESGRDLHATLEDDAPAPGVVALKVNGKYPAGVPVPTTPANILAALPPLPRILEYRILGKDLILLDQPADVIVDYMRNVIK